VNEQIQSDPIWIKLFSLVFWLVLLVVIFGSKLLSPGTYQYFITEDSLSEYAQSFFYLLGAFFALLTVSRCLRNRLYLNGALYGILALGLFFIAMEEISWGQRIVGITNPEYFNKHNVQNELTLHNLDSVQPLLRHVYIAIGFYGSISWMLAALLLPKVKLRCDNVLNFLTPPWYVAPYFFVCFCIYTFLHYIRLYYFLNDKELWHRLGEDFWYFLHWRDEEHAELFLALGFLFFTILSYRKLKIYLQASK
jgi:hypothetical protein